MEQNVSFGELLDAVDRLTSEDREALVAIVQWRVVERNRERIAAEAHEAQQEFSHGKCRPTTVDDLMDEILS